MLAPQAETDKIDDFFHLCNESNLLYPQFAKELFDETGVDIELDQSGNALSGFHENDVEEIRARYEWQKSAGLQVEHLTRDRKYKPNRLFRLTFWKVCFFRTIGRSKTANCLPL